MHAAHDRCERNLLAGRLRHIGAALHAFGGGGIREQLEGGADHHFIGFRKHRMHHAGENAQAGRNPARPFDDRLDDKIGGLFR